MKNPDLLEEAYATAMQRLINADLISEVDVEGSSMVDAFDALMEELQDERAAESKALMAMALAQLGPTELELIVDLVGQYRGRKAKYRFKKKVQRFSGLAKAFKSDEERLQEAYAELRNTFLRAGEQQ